MQKKRIVLVLIAIFLVLAGIGGTKKVIEIRQEAQKERQVAFLKAHEKEMTEYIKKEAKDVRKVTYNWNSINVERLEMELPGVEERKFKFSDMQMQKEILSFGWTWNLMKKFFQNCRLWN